MFGVKLTRNASTLLLRNSRKSDSLAAAESAEFLFRLVAPEAAFALFRSSRKTDSLAAAESAEFLFHLVPPEAAFALLMIAACPQLRLYQIRESVVSQRLCDFPST
jgi:hypothetical protein